MDLISRAQAIEVIDSFNVFESRGDQIKLEQMIGELPPANCSEFPNSSDTISRQEAIDAVRKSYDAILDFESDGHTVADSFEDIINALPPAQPDIIRCKDCKYAEYIDDVKTFWCTECGQGRTVAPNDYCSYAEREVNHESN